MYSNSFLPTVISYSRI